MTDRSPPLRAVRIEPKCPTCGKPADPKYKPFCRKRCADIDLNRWLTGVYAIPVTDDDDEDGERPADGDESEKS